MSYNKESMANTFIVTLALCLGCSLLVSLAAVGLKPIQSRNIELDRKQNILEVTGFSPADIKAAGGIESLYENRFEAKVIDMSTGKEALGKLEDALDAVDKDYGGKTLTKYDQFWASKSKKAAISDPVPKAEDVASIKYREKFSHVFILKDKDGKPSKYVLPVRGYGLWSMMRGYLALEPDFQTVAGLTFYEQAETPGLGGEVKNENWKKKWVGKKVYDPDTGAVELHVVKGIADTQYEIDGLSGATITSDGVSNMLQYWMGPSGFGPYIKQQKTGSSAASSATDQTDNRGGNHG